MEKNQKETSNQRNDGMSKEKSNQSGNQVKPNPEDFNREKKHRIGDDENSDKMGKQQDLPKIDDTQEKNRDGQFVKNSPYTKNDSQKRDDKPNQNQGSSSKHDFNKGRM